MAPPARGKLSYGSSRGHNGERSPRRGFGLSQHAVTLGTGAVGDLGPPEQGSCLARKYQRVERNTWEGGPGPSAHTRRTTSRGHEPPAGETPPVPKCLSHAGHAPGTPEAGGRVGGRKLSRGPWSPLNTDTDTEWPSLQSGPWEDREASDWPRPQRVEMTPIWDGGRGGPCAGRPGSRGQAHHTLWVSPAVSPRHAALGPCGDGDPVPLVRNANVPVSAGLQPKTLAQGAPVGPGPPPLNGGVSAGNPSSSARATASSCPGAWRTWRGRPGA